MVGGGAVVMIGGAEVVGGLGVVTGGAVVVGGAALVVGGAVTGGGADVVGLGGLEQPASTSPTSKRTVNVDIDNLFIVKPPFIFRAAGDKYFLSQSQASATQLLNNKPAAGSYGLWKASGYFILHPSISSILTLAISTR